MNEQGQGQTIKSRDCLKLTPNHLSIKSNARIMRLLLFLLFHPGDHPNQLGRQLFLVFFNIIIMQLLSQVFLLRGWRRPAPMATDPGTRKLEETWRPRLPKRSGGSSGIRHQRQVESRARGGDISKEGLRAAEERDHREGGRDPPLRGCNFSRN